MKVGADRILRLDPKERAERHARYNVRDYDLVPASFKDSKDRELYKNFNFSIFIDDFCNASCSFCVAELRYETRDLYYNKKKLFSNRDQTEYFARLREVLELVRPFDPSVSVTGGEPTISPRFPEVARLLDEYDFRKRVVTTNGTGFFRRMPGESLTNAELIAKHRFDHVNVSRAAFDEEVNSKLMKYKGRTRTSLDDLERIVSFLRESPASLRLSCVLTESGVNSFSALKEYVKSFSGLGVDNFIFRELMTPSAGDVNTEIIDWCDGERVALADLWPSFDADPEFTPVTSLLGYYYYVEVWRYLSTTVTTEAADMGQQYEEKDANADVIYETVFHENGNLTASWVDDEDILDEYVGSGK